MLQNDDEKSPEPPLNDAPVNPAKSARKSKKSRPKPDSVVAPSETTDLDNSPINPVVDVTKEKGKSSRTSEHRAKTPRTDTDAKRRPNGEGVEERPPPAVVISNGRLSVQSVQLGSNHGRHRELTELAASQLVSQLLGKLQPNESVPSIKRLREPTTIQAEDLLDDIVAEVATKRERKSVSVEGDLMKEEQLVVRSREPTAIQAEDLLDSIVQGVETFDQNADAGGESKTTVSTGSPTEKPKPVVVVPVGPENLHNEWLEEKKRDPKAEKQSVAKVTKTATEKAEIPDPVKNPEQERALQAKNLTEGVESNAEDLKQNPEVAQKAKSSKGIKGSKKKSQQRDSTDNDKPSRQTSVQPTEKPPADIAPSAAVNKSGRSLLQADIRIPNKATDEPTKQSDANANARSEKRSREPTAIQASNLLADIVSNAEITNENASSRLASNLTTEPGMTTASSNARQSSEMPVSHARTREPTEFQAKVFIKEIVFNETRNQENTDSAFQMKAKRTLQPTADASSTRQSREFSVLDKRVREPTEIQAEILLNGIISDGANNTVNTENGLPSEITQTSDSNRISVTPPPTPEQLTASPAQSTTVKEPSLEKKKRSESGKAKKKRKESKTGKTSVVISEPVGSTSVPVNKEDILSSEVDNVKKNQIPLQSENKEAENMAIQLDKAVPLKMEDASVADKEILQSTEPNDSIVSATIVPVSLGEHPVLAATVNITEKHRSSKKPKRKSTEVKREETEAKSEGSAASNQKRLAPIENTSESRDVATAERRTEKAHDDLSKLDATVQERMLSLAQDTVLARELMENVEEVIAKTKISLVNETPATFQSEETIPPQTLPDVKVPLDEFVDRPRPKHRRTTETSRPHSRQSSGQEPAGERRASTPVERTTRIKKERTDPQGKHMSKRVTLQTEPPDTPDADKHKHKPKKHSTTIKGQPEEPPPAKTVETVQTVRKSVKPDIDLPLSELIRQSIAENAQMERKIKDNTPLSELIRQSIVEPTISAETVHAKVDVLGEGQKRRESKKLSLIPEKVTEKVGEGMPVSEMIRKSLVERSNGKPTPLQEQVTLTLEPNTPTLEVQEGMEKKRRKSRTKKKDVLPPEEVIPVVMESPVPLVPVTLTLQARDEGSLLKDLSMEQLTMKLEESLETKRKPSKPGRRKGTRADSVQADENAITETKVDLPQPDEVPKAVSPVPGIRGPRPPIRRPLPRRPGGPAQNDGTQTPGGLRPRPGVRSAPVAEPEAVKPVEEPVAPPPPAEDPPPEPVEQPETDGETKKKHRKHKSPVEGEDVEERHHGHKKKRKKPKGKRHKDEGDEDEEPAESSTRKGDPLYGQSVGNFFVLEDVLGKGGFGEARRGRHITSTKKFAIKLERVADANESLAEEYKIYQIIGQHVGFPRCYYFGVGPMEHNALVMDLLGPSLEDYFRAMERKWSLKTVCLVAIQILDRIEYVHSKGYVYSDIKPENFLTGLAEEHLDGTVYLIDFGLAQQFKDKDTGKYCYDENLKTHPIGTMRYMSVRSHEGRSQSYRDDLESIGYLIIYFLRGRLPWQGLGIKDRQKKVKAVGLKKKTIPLDELCQNCPPQLQDYIKYVRSIQFYAEPKYDRLRGFFAGVMQANGWVDDGQVDWMGRAFDFTKNKKSDSGFGKPGSEEGEAEETVVETRKSVVKVQKTQKTLVDEEGEGTRTVVRKRVSPPARVGMDPTIDPLLAFNEQENKRKLASSSAPKKPEPAAQEDDYFTHRQREMGKPRRHREDHGGCYCC